VVDLTCIELATEEDKNRHTDRLAKLFKATTWEEIKMLASNNSMIENAAETIYRLSADEAIREQCEAREDYYRLQRTVQKELEQSREELEQSREELEQTRVEMEQTRVEMEQTRVEMEQTKVEFEQKEQYMQRTKQLFSFLVRDARHEDLQRACKDDAFLKILLDEYHI